MKNIIILSIALAFSLPLFPKETLKVALGNRLPPWAYKDKHNMGIIFDILTESIDKEKYDVKAIFYPYKRRIDAFKEKQVDIVIDINPLVRKEHKLNGYLSDIAYAYVNYGISLKKNSLNLKKISDIKSVSVLAWQGASTHLGGEYANAVKNHKFYTETFDQKNQVKMLFSGRVDLLQMDLNIFKFYKKILSEEKNLKLNQEIDLFPIFGESPNSILFRDEKLRDSFNKGLKKIKSSGRYEEIIKKYTN